MLKQKLHGRIAHDDHADAGGQADEQARFDAVARASDQLVLRYEYESGLRALGIVPMQGDDRDRLMERERGQVGFARPPRW